MTYRLNAVCDFRTDSVLADISVLPVVAGAVFPAGAAGVVLLLQGVEVLKEHLLPKRSTPGSHSGGTKHLYFLTCFKTV